MTFDKGSLILVDYTARVKDSEVIFDTTIEEDAKKHSIHDQQIQYRPKLVSIGDVAYPVLKGLDEALAKTAVGEKITVEVEPDKAFGQRDPGKVRMIPVRKLGDDADKVSVGDVIDIDNRRGIIRFIGSGRVQMDYNHIHAGRTILYDVKVIRSLDSPSDKIDEIIKKRFPPTDSKITFDLTDKEATIKIPLEIIRAEGLPIQKQFVQLDIFKFVPTLEKVHFVETHTTTIKKPGTTPENNKEHKPTDQHEKPPATHVTKEKTS